MNTFGLNEEKTILEQLPNGCKSAAILLNPFAMMPYPWVIRNGKEQYPNSDEMLNIGEPIKWKTVIQKTGLESYRQLGTALATSIGALKKGYANEHYSEILDSSIEPNLFYPYDNEISPFLYESILKLISEKGAENVEYYNPYSKEMKSFSVADIKSDILLELNMNESLITDNRNEYIFVGIFDQFYTLMVSKTKNISGALDKMGVEYILCDEKTKSYWFLHD